MPYLHIMEPKKESYTIVIRGFWNRMIFSPQWVMNEIFHKQEVEKLVPILPIAPLVYRDGELVLQVAEQQIVVQCRKLNNDCLKKKKKMACEVLGTLPKTPVSAIGVNFGFIETNPNDEILKLYNFTDDVEIASLNWDIGTKKIIRKLTREDLALNLTITHETPSTILFDANFHFPVDSADDAAQKIKDRTVEMHDSLIRLIENVYSLFKEEEGDE